MEGNITVKVKDGAVLKGNIWVIICLLCFQNKYMFFDDMIELSIDDQVIPKPKNMHDDT